ncbi:MAG: ABC transporter permease [Chloroflexi bacterium]|nr:ABC transporter permease [Chloroflexota bacterium]MBV9602475.1 ABC transporter permease [Chloroflexota bacterium]
MPSAVAVPDTLAPVGEGTLDLNAIRPSGFATLVQRARRSPTAMIGLLVLLVWVIVAIFWPVLVPYDPNQFHTTARLQPPSAQFLFGTDQFGRDVFSRVLAGSRDILIVAPLATLVGIACGTCLGLIAGYYRGVAGEAVLRVMDAIMAFPVVTLTLLVVAMLGPSVTNVILVIGLVFTPRVARVVYASVLSVRDLNYVAAARLRGESNLYILFGEILPTVTAPIVVEGTVRVGYAVFASATLSFLGLGIPPPAADWGLQIADARSFIQSAPWTVLFPALAIASLVIGVNLLSDGLQEGSARA